MIAGKPPETIARSLQVEVSVVIADIVAIADTTRAQMGTPDQSRAMEVARLDAMHDRLWSMLVRLTTPPSNLTASQAASWTPDPDTLSEQNKCAATLAKLLERRASLLGLDAEMRPPTETVADRVHNLGRSVDTLGDDHRTITPDPIQ